MAFRTLFVFNAALTCTIAWAQTTTTTAAPGWFAAAGGPTAVTTMEVRLAAGTSNSSWVTGRLEVRFSSSDSWGTVCDDLFSNAAASAACHSLGYSGTNARFISNYGGGTGTIKMDDVTCTATDDSLLHECTFACSHNCAHSEDVGISCPNTPITRTTVSATSNPSGTTWEVRLADAFEAPYHVYGRLEVRMSSSDSWGTVCDDSFADIDAEKACASLGLSGGSAFAIWGGGTGTIKMDNTGCTTSNTYFHQCTYTSTHDCTHSEDVGIRCVRSGGSQGTVGTACSSSPSSPTPAPPPAATPPPRTQYCGPDGTYSLWNASASRSVYRLMSGTDGVPVKRITNITQNNVVVACPTATDPDGLSNCRNFTDLSGGGDGLQDPLLEFDLVGILSTVSRPHESATVTTNFMDYVEQFSITLDVTPSVSGFDEYFVGWVGVRLLNATSSNDIAWTSTTSGGLPSNPAQLANVREARMLQFVDVPTTSFPSCPNGNGTVITTEWTSQHMCAMAGVQDSQAVFPSSTQTYKFPFINTSIMWQDDNTINSLTGRTFSINMTFTRTGDSVYMAVPIPAGNATNSTSSSARARNMLEITNSTWRSTPLMNSAEWTTSWGARPVLSLKVGGPGFGNGMRVANLQAHVVGRCIAFTPAPVPPATTGTPAPSTETPPSTAEVSWSYRLADGPRPSRGRLEVRPPSSSTWGTVCDDQFGATDARVACRSLGYGTVSSASFYVHGGGTGPIYLDDLSCSGEESGLHSCTCANIACTGSHNCAHSEDVGVDCSAAMLKMSVTVALLAFAFLL